MDRPVPGAHAPRPRLARPQRAFSIVELVIVTSIIGIAAAIAIPRYSASTVRYRLDAAARRIAADLERARTAARIGSSTRTVTFSAGAISYNVSGETSLSRAGTPYSVVLSDEPYRVHAVAASFGGAAQVTFNAFGLPSSGGQVTVWIGDDQRAITINAQTGKADIQ